MSPPRPKQTRAPWTAAQLVVFMSDYADTKTADLAVRIGRTEKSCANKAKMLGLRKSAAWLSSVASGRIQAQGSQAGLMRFQAGHTPWNKGRPHPNRSATKFKPGAVPANRLPVGHIRINSDGYQDIKVAPGPRQWVALHRWNWQQAHGAYPKPGMALVFKDGNRMNAGLANLELVDRLELMRRNSVHTVHSPEVARLAQLIGVVNRKLRAMSRDEEIST